MRIALFGANSSISQSLKPTLLENNEVITYGRSNSDYLINIENIHAKFKFSNDIDTLLFSASHFGGDDLNDYLNAININVIGTLKILDLAINAKINQFIYISSIYSHLETSSPTSNIYSISKKFSEEVLMQYAKKKSIKLTIIRPSQIIGNFESNKKHQPFFYTILKKIKNSEDIIFFGKKNPQRNYIHIDDLTEILKRVITLKVEGVFDCAYPTNTSFLEIANQAKIIFNSNSKVTFDHEKPDLNDNVFEYDLRLYKLLKFTPQISIFEGIKRLSV